MSDFRKPPRRAATAVLAALFALSLTGCPWWQSIRPPHISPESLPDGNEDSSRTPQSATANALEIEGWIRSVAGPEDSAPPEFHWHNPAIDDWLADVPDPRAALRRQAKADDRLVTANAAIALCSLGNPSAIGRVVAVVNDRQLKLPTRCAAAEALGRLDEPPDILQLRELVDKHAYQPGGSHRYVPEIHAELVRSLARHATAEDRQRLLDALRSPSGEVQLEALASWQQGRTGDLPEEAIDLRSSQHPEVRAAVLRLLAARRHPDAETHLVRALSDVELSVRAAAIEGLGTLGTETARQKLKKQLADRAELVRAAAVTALAEAGDVEEAFHSASDKSWRVRLAVAKVVAHHPDPRGQALARQLIDDPATAIGPQVVTSVGQWPLDLAGPVLLEAMGKPSYLVRKQAAEQLAVRWRPAAEFSHEAPPERRQEVLDRLASLFRREMGIQPGDAAQANASAHSPPAGSREQLDRIARHLQTLGDEKASPTVRQAAVAALVAEGPGLIGPLEQLGPRQNRPLPEAIYREVLPRCSPLFAALDRLSSDDVTVRRRAADDLVENSAREPLPQLALDRLAGMVVAEEDSLVWRSVLLAIAADGREPAMRLATAAIGHPSSEVRRRACEHLASHPDPRNARVLLPALQDSSESVVVAALRALGAGDRIESPDPLVQLLGRGNLPVQLEAARVLAHFNYPTGTAALERLALCGDPNIRREVAVAFGELADPAATAMLIHMLDDGHGVRRAALESLVRVIGRDVAAPGVGDSPSINQQVDAWKRWYEQHRNRVADRPDSDRTD